MVFFCAIGDRGLEAEELFRKVIYRFKYFLEFSKINHLNQLKITQIKPIAMLFSSCPHKNDFFNFI